MMALRLAVAIGALVALFALSACQATGVYPLDVYVEMHYSPSFRSGEPPVLSPPADAVPFTGREPDIDPQAAAQVRNPLPTSPVNLQAGARLYQLNCAVCHGPQGAGDGPMVQYFQQPPPGVPPSPPANLRAIMAQRNDGQLYLTISNGGLNMPSFKKLLSSDEVWAVMLHLRTFQGP